MKRERRVGKRCVIYALEIDFILLNRKNELTISKLTECAVNDIVGGSIVHITLSINPSKTRSSCTNVSRI